MISREESELLKPSFRNPITVPHPRFADAVTAKRPSYEKLKRALDFCTALFLLLALFPLFLLISVLIVAKDGMPVLFRHRRVGRNGKSFFVLKFRTMRNDAEAYLLENPELLKEFQLGFKLDRDPRVTPLGRWLRSCSLDELPQLINVLTGDMSLVGPRPIVEAELEKYGDYESVYLSLKPGCAGLWQCSGRSDTSYDERVQIDVEYALKASLRYDLTVFCWTVAAILRRQGAR